MNTNKSAADGNKENQKPNFTRPKKEQSSDSGSRPDEEEHDMIISTVPPPPNHPQPDKHQWHLKFTKPEEDEIVGGHMLAGKTINIAEIYW